MARTFPAGGLARVANRSAWNAWECGEAARHMRSFTLHNLRSGARPHRPRGGRASARPDLPRRGHARTAGGQPVLLIPGFLAGDDSLGADDALAAPHRPPHAQGRDRSQRGLLRGGGRAARGARRGARRGTSRGPRSSARAAAATSPRCSRRARPDLVSGIVTLGSPQLDPLAIHPLVRAQVTAVGALGTLGAPGCFRHSCLEGSCCAEFWEQLCAPTSRRTSATSRSTRAATASWTGAPASTRTPTAWRSAPATAGWP